MCDCGSTPCVVTNHGPEIFMILTSKSFIYILLFAVFLITLIKFLYERQKKDD